MKFRNSVYGFLSIAIFAITGASAAAEERPGAGAIYAITNAPTGNAVVAYTRDAHGGLSPAGVFPTGGAGTGAGLGSQGAVTLSGDNRLLFAVNAGSNSISSFRVDTRGLHLIDVAPSGGMMPTSIAFHRGLLYVLNAGAPGSVSGFRVKPGGALVPIAGSERPLSGDATAPAQVGFSARGDALIVTERATNRVLTYAVGDGGLLTGPFVYASAGPTPFGFAITKRDTLLVSEAGTGGGASTYQVGSDATLAAASSMIMTGQRAACWAAVTGNGRYGYVTNAGTGNISGFAIAEDGTASLLDADGVTAVTGGNPTDVAVSRNSRFLYVRVSATSEIAVFRIHADGSLEKRPSLTGTPAGLAGLAGF
jgi:6-phosphogluconolactonase (cycloisomerase 2 family)